MRNVLLLTTRDGFLTGSLKREDRSIVVQEVVQGFGRRGYHVEVRAFEEIEDYTQYKGWFIAYASSEDQGLFYKSYIEDIMLALEQAGALLLPRFELLRAHHNKSYMEMRRSLLSDEKFKTISSKIYSSWDSLVHSQKFSDLVYPLVVKASAGSGSIGVMLVRDARQLKIAVKKASNVYFFAYTWQSFCQSRVMHYARHWRRKLKKNAQPVVNSEEKFIIQNFIDGMDNDYKVLIFGKKYYILKRKNRDNDFRASGSGKFEFPQKTEDVAKILEFAYSFYQVIDSPLCSLDIGTVGETCHLLEFQCLNFGPYTLQFSPCWFERGEGGSWIKIEGDSILEEEYVRALCEYIEYQCLQSKEY